MKEATAREDWFYWHTNSSSCDTNKYCISCVLQVQINAVTDKQTLNFLKTVRLVV